MPARTLSAKLVTSVSIVMIAAGLAGCANRNPTTGSIGPSASRMSQMSEAELNGEAARLGKKYAKNPTDKATAMSYATLLQMNGRTEQSLAVMRKLAIALPKDRQVLAAYGKSLAGAGQFEPALDAIRRAQTPEYPDWKLFSAEASILDQLGQKNEARALFNKAADLKPNEPSILSNLGMSYLMEGDLRTAETHMRKAVEMPGADSRVRQNLALVVGLQGRFDEAEQIARQELSPDQAQANVDYMRQMLSQQNAWNDLKKDEKKKKDTN